MSNLTSEPDLALVNGKIWTVNKHCPYVEAVACLHGKIIAVGTTEKIKQYITKRTEVIDLHGKFAMPGFNDAHVDFYRGGISLQSVDLRDAVDDKDFARRIQNHVKKLPPGTWITEGNWNHENWPNPKMPHKELTDPFTKEHPVIVCRLDEHVLLANSLALKLANIDEKTTDPPGGEIKKDPITKKPTGILIDTAQQLVMDVIPEPTLQQRITTIKTALQHAAQFGITSIQDNTSLSTLRIYQELLKNDELTLRVNAWRPIATLDNFSKLGIQENFGNDMLHLGVVKIFADGSMGAGSALFFEPYADEPSTSGLAMYPEEELTALIMKADALGLQCAVHAIGDKANNLVLNACHKAREKNPNRATRHRIEHAQVILPDDLIRFKELNIIGSLQPSHCIDDMKWAYKRIGADRVKNAYLWRSFFDNGIKIAFGTDWPVALLNPMITLYAAVTRSPLDDKPQENWFPEEKLSLEQAIECYTLSSAYAEFAEHQKGSIEPGKYADIIVLSQNLFNISPKKFLDTEVIYTILNGKVIYQRK